MASRNKIKKCKNSFLSNTAQKMVLRLKRVMFYNKSQRVIAKKVDNE